MSNATRALYNLFLFQALKSINFQQDECLHSTDFEIPLRILILDDFKHKRILLDFTSKVLEQVTYFQTQIVKFNSTGKKVETITNQLIVAWHWKHIEQSLEKNSQTLLPNLRAKYYFFSLEGAPKEDFLERMWRDSGISNVYFCRSQEMYNLRGVPIKVAFFERESSLVFRMPKVLTYSPIYGTFLMGPKLYGLDAFVIKTIATNLNFSLEFVGNFEKNDYGYVMENGTTTGTLGVVARNEAWLGMNSRYLTDYGTDEVEFLHPHVSDQICAIVPESRVAPLWLVVSQSFKLYTWLCIYLTFVILIVLWYFLSGTSVSRTFWEIYYIFHGIPVRTRGNHTFFLFWGMFGNVLLSSIIQGAFVKYFTTSFTYEDIRTIDELDATNFPIATHFQGFDIYGSPSTARKLEPKQIKRYASVLDDIAFNRNVSLLESKMNMESFIKSNYFNDNGTPLLQFVDECMRSYYNAYIVPKGSVLLEPFNAVILKLVEGGLVEKWFRDFQYSQILEKLLSIKISTSRWKPFKMNNFIAMLIFWTLGMCLSLIIFLFELFVYRGK